MVSVTDAGDKTKGFVDAYNLTNDYLYDANGNLILDKNKGIATIAYNYLNLPSTVTKTTGDIIRYVYDASGRKLHQQLYLFGSTLPGKRTDYAGEFYYENDTLKFITMKKEE